MPQQSFEFHMSLRKLLLGLLVTVLPISLFAFYTVEQTGKRMEETVGNQYKTIAESAASEISQFIHAHVVEASLMASDSAVIDMIKTANESYRGMSDAAIAERIKKMEAVWNTPQGEDAVQRTLSNRAAEALRRKLELDPKFLRITITDERGATVAASHKTIDYYQADEEYWQNIYAEGRGAISLTDILYDQPTKANYIGIGVPVVEKDYRVIGTFDALIDVTSLAPIIKRAHLGRTARVLLVKGDGTVITSSDGGSLSLNVKSEEFAAVADRLPTLQGRQSGYILADLRDEGETVIGFSDTGLKEDFQELDWMVLIAQSSREAFAAIRGTVGFIVSMAFLALAAVTFIGVYFSLHRRSEIEEIEEEMAHPRAAVGQQPAAGGNG